MNGAMRVGPLTAELERALLHEIAAEYRSVNRTHFKGALRAPTLELVHGNSRLGRWDRESRSLELSRSLVLSQPWPVVVEVLKHEMAHQYAHEVLRATDEAAHGPAFREVCARLGIDPAAAGLPRAEASPSEERLVTRVARLLALAESANVHEAEAAASAAHRLMLKYNIDAARCAGAPASGDVTGVGGYCYAHVGSPTGRVSESERMIAMILGRYFFVEVIWVPVYRAREGKRGSVLELCGSRANLAMAEYVHGFLTHTAEHLWAEHKRALGVRSNRDRRTYLAGVIAGFAERLAREHAAHRKAGLVWVGDGDLARYFRRRHPHVRHVRHVGERRNEAFAHGRAAGRRIVLHKAVQPASENRGRLLPEGR